MPLSKEARSKYLRAGRIASRVRDSVKDVIHGGLPIVELCERVEEEIRKHGAKPAFPCNVCVNEVAAHYTSPIDDRTEIPDRSLVKVDLGVHIDGYIADTAVSVALDPMFEPLVDAAEAALKTACQLIRAGITASEIGKAVQQTIEGLGFKPIWNLHGHKIARYFLHAGKCVPSVGGIDRTRLEEGEVYAIEPFVTSAQGAGEVIEVKRAFIFRYAKEHKVSEETSVLLKKIRSEFRSLPFTPRWLLRWFTKKQLSEALSELLASGSIVGYPVLIERRRKPVAQAEHTIIVEKGGCQITTL